jgi:hypothetical protein
MKKVYAVIYTDDSGNPKREEVGQGDVEEIEEHKAQGEGDKWYYDIYFKRGLMTRIFNLDRALFKTIEEAF